MAYGIFKRCLFPDHENSNHRCNGLARLTDNEDPLVFPTQLHAQYFIDNFAELYGDTEIKIEKVDEDITVGWKNDSDLLFPHRKEVNEGEFRTMTEDEQDEFLKEE